MTLRLLRALAAVLLGTTAGAVALASPAHAAACPAGTGVTVVVNSSVGCDADGGGRASDNFSAAGHQLRFASRAPGFVCRVDGAPADDPCVEASPSDAYWGLFWSDGTTGSWTYSSLGVTALKVPKGGSVAFVFQGSSRRTMPAVSAQVVSAEPTQQPTRSPGAGSNGGGSSAPGVTEPKKHSTAAAPRSSMDPGSIATPSSAPATGATPTPTASEPTDATAPPSAAADSVDAAGSSDSAIAPLGQAEAASGTSTPAVIAAVALVVLLGVAVGVVWRRRRAG